MKYGLKLFLILLCIVQCSVGFTAPASAEGLSITIDGLTEGARINVEQLDRLSVSVTGAEILQVDLYDNGALLETCVSAPYTFDISELLLGVHTLRAVLTGENGATAEDSVKISVYQAQLAEKDNYDFEEYVSGNPEGFAGHENTGYYKGDVVDPEHGTSLFIGVDETYEDKVAAGAKGGAFLDHKIGAGVCQVECEVWLSSVDQTFEVVMKKDSVSQTIAQFNQTDFKIRNTTGGLAGTINGVEAGTWYRLRIDLDMENHTYSAALFYQDGTQKGETLSSALKPEFDQDTLWRFNVNASRPVTMAVDNYVVSEWTQLPVIEAVGDQGIPAEDGLINPLGGMVDLFLSAAVNPHSVTADKVKLSDGGGEIGIAEARVAEDGKIITITPESVLEPGRDYLAILKEGIEDVSGVPTNRDTVIGFQTLESSASIKISNITDGEQVDVNNLETLRVEAIAADVEAVALYDNGQLLDTLVEGPYLFDISGLALGSHELTAQLTDIYGEIHEDTVHITVYQQKSDAVISYDFTDYSAGRPGKFGGWENLGFYKGAFVDPAYGTSAAIGVDGSYEEKLAAGAAGGAFLSHEINRDKFTIGYHMRLDALNSVFNIEMNQSGNNQTIINFDHDQMKIRNASNNIAGSIEGLQADTWYYVSIYADTVEHLYTVSLFQEDGTQVGSTLGAELKPGINASVTYRLYGPNTPERVTMYLDDFTISEISRSPSVRGFGHNGGAVEGNIIDGSAGSFDVFLTGAVNAESVSPETVRLYDGAREIPVSRIEMMADSSGFTVVPAVRLKSMNRYRIILSERVRDGGNKEIGRENVGVFYTAEQEVEIEAGRFQGGEFSARVKNNTAMEKTIYFIFSGFDGDRLGGSRMVEYTAPAGNSSFRVAVPEISEGKAVEVYVWDRVSPPNALTEKKFSSKG